jgi:T4-like virus tail tube protein gp19
MSGTSEFDEFDVVGAPGSFLALDLAPGDLILRRGEGGFGHAAIVADPRIRTAAELLAEYIPVESHRTGFYATVSENSPYAEEGELARRITDENGQLSFDTLILRPSENFTEVVRASFVRRAFVLELAGVNVGSLSAFAGGEARREVLATSGQVFARKNISGADHEDFTMQIGLSMAPAVYDWIAAAWKGQHMIQDGAVIVASADLKEIQRYDFHNASIRETNIPTLDASSQEVGHLTVKFTAELVRSKSGSGSPTSAGVVKAKPWYASNFRLQIDGLDCAKVRKIDSFAVTNPIIADAIGSRVIKRVGAINFPTFSVTLLETAAKTWRDWLENSLTDDAKHLKNGTLTFLAPDQTELGRIALRDVGISKFSSSRPFVIVQLFCERMDLFVPGSG